MDSYKSFHFLFYDDAHPGFWLSPCLVIGTKIARRTRDKIDATSVLNRSRIFRRREFNFLNRLKVDFEAKSSKRFKYFERDRRIKTVNDTVEIRMIVTNKTFRLLKIVQGFIHDVKVEKNQEILSKSLRD